MTYYFTRIFVMVIYMYLQNEKIKKSLKVKLEMAKFLQNTIEESALQRQKKIKEGEKSMVVDFSSFLKKVSMVISLQLFVKHRHDCSY